MRILIATPRQDHATGNWTTATRFEKGLSALGHELSICGTTLEPAALDQALSDFDPEVVLLLHAFRAGRPWHALKNRPLPPYLVLLTGTDIHEGVLDPRQAPVIEKILEGASAIMLQNHIIAENLRADRPDLAERVHDLPPGIELGTEPYPLRELHKIPADEKIFLCPASLRPVKGVLELLFLFDPLARTGERFRLLFCGPDLHGDYSRTFFSALAQRPWADYLGIIPPGAMPAAMKEADLVLNNSISEGLPNALVEAAALGRPILARDIPGNAAVVESGVNGLLYADAESFTHEVTKLLTDPALLKRLSAPRPDLYTPAREAALLNELCLRAKKPRSS